MAEARLAAWRMDLPRTLDAAQRMATYNGNVAGTLLDIISRFMLDDSFDEMRWQDAMHRLAHNDLLSSRQRLITYQRAVEAAAVIGRFEEGLEALTTANRIGLVDINWADGCQLFRPWASDSRWRAQRDILAARAERVLVAYRTAAA